MAEPASPLSPLFVPNVRSDRGMGHLRRCLSAAAEAPGSAVYYAADPELTGGHAVFDQALVQNLAGQYGVRLLTQWPAETSTVVADLQAVSPAGFDWLRARSPRLLGWDEGGRERGRFPYLVDSLPHGAEPAPNVRLPGLLGLNVPETPHRYDRPVRKVLAVFGGADPAGLTVRFLRFVENLRQKGLWPYTLTVVRGPLARFTVPPDTEVLDAPTKLADLLGQWDLVVTSWGLTTLESLAAGTPVVLLHPTTYHARLADAAGLPSFGVRKPSEARFLRALADAAPAAAWAASQLLKTPAAAGPYFSRFHGGDGRCPVCRTAGHPVFYRTEQKSYHRCGECGMEYLSAHQMPPKQYSEAYFFEEYKKQYGKTYLDDFAHIQGMGAQRLEVLSRVLPGSKRLLDAGCAYGPFLAAAKAAGHTPFGLDVAEGAVEHVKSLGFPAVRQSFLDLEWASAFPGENGPDVLTMWYVIEHFPDLDAVLRQANRLLPVGGAFAFSTPNGHGITRRFRGPQFWIESPDDHFSIWNPRNARRVLARFGFRVVAVRVTGHHPERFPGVRGQGLAFSLLSWCSRLWGWGDTFEIYALKTGDPS